MAVAVYEILKENIEGRKPGYTPGCCLLSYREAARELGFHYLQWNRIVKKLERDGLVTIQPIVSGMKADIVIK